MRPLVAYWSPASKGTIRTLLGIATPWQPREHREVVGLPLAPLSNLIVAELTKHLEASPDQEALT